MGYGTGNTIFRERGRESMGGMNSRICGMKIGKSDESIGRSDKPFMPIISFA
ncbi:MAG: hypothetical protein J2P54_04025 [Bradyrhizobiaceae bacterium]|nr:hypothetical protein [Bradyrhizobiaceae bacterium]